ncbi:hypothetical protein I2494_07300 [Budviciaceae bacterium BWR-B9]|uniref:DUF416 family protein n=1 Tax=Limnobaculum allomyrinae TaxID=2791986 RepID=A0ABS1IPE7_9GAMM|nr:MULTISPECIES: hypothetical protein [Limnobaculum]MBK5143524.1 hypothetical protein [Limnobaculum allomyrinae]MBV7691412.1 hypothetical protein [Limnobaculum sp. M2-1]
MDPILKEKLAVRLCAADISCAYIAVNPILDNRDELIENQHAIYRILLDNIETTLTPEFVGIEHNALDQLWCSAIELTAADIISEAISLNPVLYDRTEKVNERIIFHFNRLKNCFSMESQNEAQQSMISAENEDTTPQYDDENEIITGNNTPDKTPILSLDRIKILHRKHKRRKK